MKRLFTLLVSISSVVLAARAQLDPPISGPEPADYSIIARGPHHRVWAAVSWQTNALGRVTALTNSYTELAGGLHHLVAGEWVESQEIIESVVGGAVARHGQIIAAFANNLATSGAIDMELPSGEHLTSQIIGLSYFDAASGTNILITSVKSCQGKILPPNQVLYEDAFENVKGSVRFTYTRNGCEQDIILLESPPPPENYHLDRATTRLVVMSEFITPVQPVREVAALKDQAGTPLQDETLSFGVLQIGEGKGLLLGSEGPEPEVRVWKQWATLEGRQFLLEQVPAAELLEAMAGLPGKQGASLNTTNEAIRFTASTSGRLPSYRPAEPGTNTMLVASTRPPEVGYLLDYRTVLTTNDFTFLGGETYFVSGSISLSGKTTWEGSSIVKFTNNATLSVASNLVIRATQFTPIILSSMHDNSVGTTVLNSTGNPVRTTATYLAHSGTAAFDYKHLRFRFAGTAIMDYGSPAVTVWHSQFLNCGICVHSGYLGGMGKVILYNVLMSQCQTDAAAAGSIVASGAHVTANAMDYLHGVAEYSGQYHYYTNSIARDISNWIWTDPRQMEEGDYSDYVVKESWETSPFTPVGAGSFYTSSNYWDVGKTALAAPLWADLQTMTTYPPIVFSNLVISVNTNLAVHAPRDTNSPDLGYHFTALDYAFSGVRVTNATVRLLPGTAIASFGSSYGLGLLSGAQLICEGTPTNLNHIVRFNLVQECSNTNWNGGSTSVEGDWLGGPVPAQATFRFTDWSMPAQDGYHFSTYGYTMTYAFSDCQFHGGKLYLDAAAFTITNSLLERVYTSILDFSPMSPAIRNCLFYGGQLYVDRLYDGTWTFRDNLFDRAAITKPEGTVDAAYNGFTTNTANALGGTYNQTNLVADYQTGPLGYYYYPTNGGSYSLTNLVNHGSTWATNLGLYYFTTTTNQALEGASKLDIGFHFLAVNASGTPIDTDGDGMSDYWESLHGLNPQDASDGNDDPDGDGVTNYQEYLANSDPHDAWIVVWGGSAAAGYKAPSGLNDVATLEGGLFHTVALRSNGVVAAWGGNHDGQTSVPARWTDVLSIAASAYQNAALRSDGTVSQWGKYWYAQALYSVAPPAGLSNVTGIAVGKAHALALKSDGSLQGWGVTGAPYQVPTNVAGVKAIAAGWQHSVALKTNGTVVAWGDGGMNLTNVPAGLSNVTAISAGGYHTLALRSNGTVVAWGAGQTIDGNLWNKGQSIVPPDLSNVVAVAAGGFNSVALLGNGTVVGWGETNAPTGLGNVAAIGAGDGHCLALRTGRQTPLILQSPAGRCADSGATAVFSGLGLGPASVRYQWQTNGVDIAGATNTILTLVNVQTNHDGDYRLKVSNGAGASYTSAATLTVVKAPVIRSRTLPVEQTFHYGASLDLSVAAETPGICPSQLSYCWSSNSVAGLNQTATNLAIASLKAADEGVYSVLVTNRGGSASNVAWTIHVAGEGSPIWWGGGTQSWSCLQGVHDVSALAVGSAHYLAARDNGMILAWGDNTSGQTNVPLNLSNVVGVAAGDAHSLALKADGTVVAWGSNTSNQTNVPPGLTNVTAIAAGGNQSLALRQDGTVVQWGLTNTAIPAWVTNVTAIASGSNFNLALLRNTTVAAWGANDYGKTNLPANLSNVVAIAAGAWHGLAVKSNGNVVAWGLNTSGQAPVSLALSNVMAVAGGAAHSMALKNDGTVVAWGSTNAGQTTVPSWLGPVKLLGAGGNQSLVSMFSPLVQYPVDVTKDLLLIYNTNSLDSSNVCAYYLQHRPMAGGANVLGIACPTNELINTSTFNNQINASIQIWLAGNPTKHPQYIILFPDLPTRVWGNVSDPNTIVGSVAYGLSTNTVGIRPFVTSINMRDFDSSRPATNACIAYIDKLAFFGTNYSPGKLVISPSCRNYWNTNYLVDDVGWYAPGIFYGITNALLDAGVPPASITYLTANEPCVLWDADTNCIQRQAMPHITNAMNVASYDCWGVYSTLGSRYAITGVIKWQGNSGWWVIETHESANGIQQSGVGNYWTWFDYSSFGGTNYENTPVGAVSNTDEPYGYGGTYPNIYFGLWARGKSFAISAWNAIKTSRFQAVGDPFVVR